MNRAYEKKNNGNLNQNQNQEEEKPFYVKFKEDFMQGFFKVVYVLLKEDENTFWKFQGVLFIEFLQLLFFTFNTQYTEWRSGTVFDYISKFFSFFHLSPWFKEIGYSGYLALFYISVFLVILIILGMFYVSYSNNQKRFSFVWPLQALRTIILLVTTILYMPILETFLVMINCSTINGTRSLTSFPSVQCFSGQHIVHGTISVISMIAFLSILHFILNTHYKTIHTLNDAASKINPKTEVKLHHLKTALTVQYIFLVGNQYHWFLILFLLIGSLTYYNDLKYNKPYFNQRITLFLEMSSFIFLWGNFCLLLAKCLELTTFAGGALQLYFLGLPVSILAIFFSQEKRLKYLLQPLSNMEKGEDVEYQIRFLLYLIQNKEQSRDCEVLLKGYIFHHEDNCPLSHCLLKQYKSNLNQIGKNKKGNKKLTLKNIQSENQQILYQHAKNLFNAGLQKFQISTQLRISYGCFLLHILKKKQEAINEFNIAAKQSLLLDESFSIYRNLRMSEELADSFQESGNSGMDIGSKILFEQNCKQLRHIIEKSAQLHLDFWNQLRSDRPDLSKLNSCGSKINSTIVQAEQLWMQIQKLNTNAPKVLKLYAKFHNEILNDKESGEELLMRAKDLLNIKGNALEGGYIGLGDDVNNILQFSTDGTPCIQISGDLDKIGLILQCNAGASRIFGYSSFEIKNHPVEKLMPEMYAKHHAKVLDDALQKGPENIPNKERLVFARHKSGYIFPIWLQLKMISSLQNGIQFIALFKIDKKIISSNIAFLIINKDKKIQGLSSGCMKLLNLDIQKMKKISNYGYDIGKLAPDLIQNQQNYLQKGGAQIELVIPEFQRNKKLKSSKRENVKSYFDKNSTVSKESGNIPKVLITYKNFNAMCQLSPIIMGNVGEIGFSIKLELINEDRNKLISKKTGKLDKLKQPLFQFRYDAENAKYIREIKDSMSTENANKDPNFINGEFSPSILNNSALVDYLTPRQQNKTPDQIKNDSVGFDLKDGDKKSKDQQQTQQQDQDLAPQLTNPNEDLIKKKRKWGDGIPTFVLSQGKFRPKDYDEDEAKEKELEEKRRRKKEEEEKALLNMGNVKNNIKSRKALHMAINDKTTPQSIKNLRITMNIVIAALLALAIAEYIIISNQFSEINDNFNLIFKAYRQISEVQRIVYDVRSLVLINQGNLTSYQNYTNQPDFRVVLKQDINEALNNVYALQNNISLSKLPLSDAHDNLMNNKSVVLSFKQNDNSLKQLNFSLNEAVLQISSAIFTVVNLNNSQYTEFQEDTYFVTYNSFNEFLIALRLSAQYYSQELIERTSSKTNLVLFLFLSAVGTSVLAMIILYPVVQSVNSARTKVLTLFIEIPNVSVITLSEKCEEFLNNLYDDQGDDINSESGSYKMNSRQSQTHKKQNKRSIHKTPKNTSKTNQKFFFQLGIAILLSLGYFLAIYIVDSKFISKIREISKELTAGSLLEASFSYAQNIQREMIYNSSKKVLGNQDSFNASLQALNDLYHQSQNALKIHYQNRYYMDQNFINEFSSLMYDDICNTQVLNLTLLYYSCTDYDNNLLIHVNHKFSFIFFNQGAQSLLVRYFESLRNSLNAYVRAKKTNQSNEDLLNKSRFERLYILQFIFLQQTFRELSNILINQVNADYTLSANSRMAAFMVFIIILIVSYLILWTPFVNKLNKEIWKTKSMLTIIPIEIILSIPKIQEFLHNQSFFSNDNKKNKQIEEEPKQEEQ